MDPEEYLRNSVECLQRLSSSLDGTFNKKEFCDEYNKINDTRLSYLKAGAVVDVLHELGIIKYDQRSRLFHITSLGRQYLKGRSGKTNMLKYLIRVAREDEANVERG